MNSRFFELKNDLKEKGKSLDYINLKLSILLISKLIEDINIILEECELNDNDKDYLYDCIENFIKVIEKYEDNESGFDQTYLKYLENEEIDEEYFKHARDEFKACFDIENEIKKRIIGPIWERYLTKVGEFNNNGEFAFVVHASTFDKYIVLPQSKNFKKEDDKGYISCSIITEDEMELGGIFGIVYGVDSNSYIVSSYTDAATVKTREDSVINVEKLNNDESISISGGIGLFTFDYADYKGIYKNPEQAKRMLKTKIDIPTTIVKKAREHQVRIAGEILNYDYEIKRINAFKFTEMGESFDDALKHAGVELTQEGLASVKECGYTEVVLNKKYAQPMAVVFTTTGCDFNFKQYATAKKMSQDYNLPLVRINKAICRKRNNMKPNTDFELADLDRQINEFLDEENLEMMSNDWENYKIMLKDYYHDIIIGKDFDKAIANKIINTINRFAEYVHKKRKIESETQEFIQELE